MRVVDQENESKWVRELQDAFRSLKKDQKKVLMDLAIEVDKNIPFQKRKKTEYHLHKEKYSITNHTQVDDVLTIREDESVETPKEEQPSDLTPSPTGIVVKNENDIELVWVMKWLPDRLFPEQIYKDDCILEMKPSILITDFNSDLYNRKIERITDYLRKYNFSKDNQDRYIRGNVAIDVNTLRATGHKIVFDITGSSITKSEERHVQVIQKILNAPF